MTTIVLDDKDADDEARSRNGQQQSQPLADVEAEQHEEPTKRETSIGIDDLPNAFL